MDILTERVAWAIEIIKKDKALDKGIKDVDLAKILGTNKDTLAGYRQGRGLLKGEVIENLVKHYRFSPEWLFHGAGEPFPGARANHQDVCGPEPAPLYNKDMLAPIEAQKINVDEAMGKTYKVLNSGTPYAVALYLNIQQFSNALDMAYEIKQLREEVGTLRDQVANLQRQIDRLSALPTTATAQEDTSKLAEAG